MENLHLAAWVDFYQSVFGASEVPPMPKSPNELPMTVKMALENWDEGKLNQNLFGNAGQGVGLPADVQLRLQNNALLPEDEGALRKANLTFYAEQCAQARDRIQSVAMEKQARLSEERAKAAQAEYKAFQDIPLGAKPPSPEAIQQFREQIGYTGKPSWEN